MGLFSTVYYELRAERRTIGINVLQTVAIVSVTKFGDKNQPLFEICLLNY
jgi:hypothetical protein